MHFPFEAISVSSSLPQIRKCDGPAFHLTSHKSRHGLTRTLTFSHFPLQRKSGALHSLPSRGSAAVEAIFARAQTSQAIVTPGTNCVMRFSLLDPGLRRCESNFHLRPFSSQSVNRFQAEPTTDKARNTISSSDSLQVF